MPRAQASSATTDDAAVSGRYRPDLAANELRPPRMVRLPRLDGALEDEDEEALEACVIAVAGDEEKDHVGKYAELLATPVAAALGAVCAQYTPPSFIHLSFDRVLLMSAALVCHCKTAPARHMRWANLWCKLHAPKDTAPKALSGQAQRTVRAPSSGHRASLATSLGPTCPRGMCAPSCLGDGSRASPELRTILVETRPGQGAHRARLRSKTALLSSTLSNSARENRLSERGSRLSWELANGQEGPG